MERDPGVAAASFEASPGNAAILDADGVIVAVNEGWRAFGTSQGLEDVDASVGRNYVAACRGSDDEWAVEAADGLEALLAGDDERFSLEYPCHSPDERRWFLLRAVRFDHDGDGHVLVTHLDITDRKEAELEVKRRESELEDVISLLAHDVRNPVGAAMGWLDAIEPSDATERDAIERVARSLDRIDETVDDALTFMRADTATWEVERVDGGALARSLWTGLPHGDATLVVDGEFEVECYRELFSHLLENLLTNALEHGGEGVTVTVGATSSGFYVADDGPGIPPEEHAEVFEMGTTSSPDGTGFGLTIVESVVDRHGWEIEVGESEDGGARFEVRTRPAFGSGDRTGGADDSAGD